jgi:proteasome lid subunit RPN8/RPN11
MSNAPTPNPHAAASPAPPDPNRDADRTAATVWSRRTFPYTGRGLRRPTFQAVLRQSVLNAIHAHGRSSPEVEVCGVLVGNVYHDGRAPYVYVEAAIAGNAAAGRATEVTFTAETWAQIQQEMDGRYPDARIVGWYHTHPGFGIFLSEMDRFIHDNFFGEPWQLAYEYDPKRHEDGLFVWRRGQPAPEPYLVEPDERASGPAPRPSGNATDRLADAVRERQTAAAAAAADAPPDLTARVQGGLRRHPRLWLLVAVLALLALAAPVAALYYLGREVPGLPTEGGPRAAPTSASSNRR